MKNTYKETDMYEPIANMLTQQGFTVRGEVKGCDIVAVCDDILVIVEMKLSISLKLIYQAMERQSATDLVYVAIPRPKKARDRNFMRFKNLIKKLQLGLITVALDSPTRIAEIIIFPTGRGDKSSIKSVTLRKELVGRSTDTIGGGKGKINTAYRERCVHIACLMEAYGPLSAKTLTKIHGCEKDAYAIISKNHYNWFEKIEKGLYNLSEIGKLYLQANDTDTLVAYYKKQLNEASNHQQ